MEKIIEGIIHILKLGAVPIAIIAIMIFIKFFGKK
tara:strand:- start:258 stop:362 length:105 start_codon:yes stop_codon:yes gene_type:complete